MSVRKLGFDRATLDSGVVEEDDEYLVMRAVIARELVQEYPEGRAYKPAEELEKAAWTAEGRWVAVMRHPDTGLITRRSDVKGRVESAEFVKDIVDPKTRRPMVRGIRANIKWFKKDLPKQLLEDVKSGVLKDVSIGFTYEEDGTPGEWEGEAYDFAQRNIFIDHVVAPCPLGRCPSPYCGIGVDSILKDHENEVGEKGNSECPDKQESKAPSEEEKPSDPVSQTSPATPPEDKIPDVRELIARTEELLGIWRKLSEKSASFT